MGNCQRRPLSSGASASSVVEEYGDMDEMAQRLAFLEFLEKEKAAIIRLCDHIPPRDSPEWQRKVGTLDMYPRLSFFSDDKEVALACVRVWGGLQSHFPEFRTDRDVMLATVTTAGQHLRYAHPFQDDKEVVVAAVRNDGDALRSASMRQRGDKEVVLLAVSNCGSALRYASDALRKDKEVVQAAVSNDGRALEFASKMLHADREVILSAARTLSGPENARLCHDKDFVLQLARQPSRRGIFDDRPFHPGEYYDAASQHLQLAVARPTFISAARSALAIPGQPAVVLLVNLTRKGPQSGGGFNAKASILSGEEFDCNLRERATVTDLATQLVVQLQQAGKAGDGDHEHVFINIRKGGTDDFASVTPWDSDRPLSHFLSTRQRRRQGHRRAHPPRV